MRSKQGWMDKFTLSFSSFLSFTWLFSSLCPPLPLSFHSWYLYSFTFYPKTTQQKKNKKTSLTQDGCRYEGIWYQQQQQQQQRRGRQEEERRGIEWEKESEGVLKEKDQKTQNIWQRIIRESRSTENWEQSMSAQAFITVCQTTYSVTVLNLKPNRGTLSVICNCSYKLWGEQAETIKGRRSCGIAQQSLWGWSDQQEQKEEEPEKAEKGEVVWGYLGNTR